MVSYRLGDLHVPLVDNREALGKLVEDFARAIRKERDAIGRRLRCRRRGGDRGRASIGRARRRESRRVIATKASASPFSSPALNEATRCRRCWNRSGVRRIRATCGGARGGRKRDGRNRRHCVLFGARVVHNPVGRAEPAPECSFERRPATLRSCQPPTTHFAMRHSRSARSSV